VGSVNIYQINNLLSKIKEKPNIKSKRGIKEMNLQYRMKIVLVGAVLYAVWLIAGTAMAQGTGRLVSTKWLAEHKDDPTLVIIDASKTKAYLKDHIQNAVSASFSAEDVISYGIDTSYGGDDLLVDPNACLPWHAGPPDYVENQMRNLGINNDSTVVIYDEGAIFHAPQFFFALTYHGHKNAYILDGGLPKWVSDGYPVTKEVPKVKRGDFVAKIVDPSLAVNTDYVLTRLYKQDTIVVYTVTSKWYYGGYLAYNRPGHIPSSVLAPYPDQFQKDKTWRPFDVLKRQYAAQGILPEKEVIVYCGGNPASTSAYFTLRHVLGYSDVKVYYDATTGWLNDPRDLPMHTYQNQHLLRDAFWVHWWAGKRIQYLLRDPGVIVVDVRPEDKYKAGHIAYSVNIPILDLMKKGTMGLKDWETLLGQKGIGRQKEVVLYDDQKGEAASVMFWLLEYLGQPKVSILKGGLAAWHTWGLELTQDETVVAEPKTKFDVAIKPETFVAVPENDRRLIDAKEEPDFFGFPRVWIISSKKVPAEAPSAGYAHIPWDQNIDKEGNFKSAAELIDLYEGAGILKYAEIACYSDSIQDATLTYYALRTLGYPRVRVYFPTQGAL
jgi:thiosulfate/3-mercaptopyruvate sulfurtransferase